MTENERLLYKCCESIVTMVLALLLAVRIAMVLLLAASVLIGIFIGGYKVPLVSFIILAWLWHALNKRSRSLEQATLDAMVGLHAYSPELEGRLARFTSRGKKKEGTN